MDQRRQCCDLQRQCSMTAPWRKTSCYFLSSNSFSPHFPEVDHLLTNQIFQRGVFDISTFPYHVFYKNDQDKSTANATKNAIHEKSKKPRVILTREQSVLLLIDFTFFVWRHNGSLIFQRDLWYFESLLLLNISFFHNRKTEYKCLLTCYYFYMT